MKKEDAMRSYIIALVAILAFMAISSPTWAQGGVVVPGSEYSVSGNPAGNEVSAQADTSVQIVGIQGPQGDRGPSGSRGATGLQGIGISEAWISSEHLYLRLTDNSVLNTGEVVGEDGVGISSVCIDQSGNLLVFKTNGELINAGPIFSEQEKPESCFPYWFWPVIIFILLIILAILIGVYLARRDHSLAENEAARINTGSLMTAGAILHNIPCRFKEQGRSGSQEFSIGISGTDWPPKEVWPYARPDPDKARPVVSDQFTKRLEEIFRSGGSVEVRVGKTDKKLVEEKKPPKLEKPKPDKPSTQKKPVDPLNGWDGLTKNGKPFNTKREATSTARRRGISSFKIESKGTGYKVVAKT